MPLDVIGAGFGRTGTNSLKLALERLGFGPCHHMFEIRDDPARLPPWERLAAGGDADWGEVFADYRAQVDWPGAAYWRELSEAFPEAKVILSTRDPEAWRESLEKTILRFMATPDAPDAPHVARMRAMAKAVIDDRVFDGRMHERAHSLAVFRAHEAEVKATIPPERLLVFEASQGWGPLCDFLGAPVPGEPFPNTNSTQEFHARSSGRG